MRVQQLALVTALAVPSTSIAGGYALPVHGVRALAVGGAQTAGATGMDALFYNPALLDQSTVSAEVGFVHLISSYTAIGGSQDGVTVENDASPTPNPSVGGVWRINDWGSVAFGAYAPWSGQYRFPEGGPQRYALVENNKSSVVYFHLAGAFRIGDFSVGLGIQNVLGHIRQRSVLSAYPGLSLVTTHSEDPDTDILSELELFDPVTISGNFGVSYDFGPVVVAIAGQLPYSIEGDADFRNRLPSHVLFDPTEIEGDKAFLSIPFPFILSGGVHVRPFETWSIEASVRWENWSIQDELIIDPQGRMVLHGVPLIGDYEMRPIRIEKRMRDTVSLHLGTDIEVVSGLHVRAGGFFETSAFPDETYSVALLDDQKLALALGLSWWVGPARLDLAFAHIFSPGGDRVVTGSELRQVNPTYPEQATIIGNGTYSTSMWTGGLSFAWLFD